MFRNEMLERLSKIFGFNKTTYEAPSAIMEQDTLFIEINDAQSRVTDEGKAYAKVNGSLIVYADDDKMPFGYFNKRIQEADPELTRRFFFFEIDHIPSNSPAKSQNISERRVRFVYLYSGQYDPQHGQLNNLKLGGTQ